MKEKSAFVTSRRRLLTSGSAVIAGATLVGLSATALAETGDEGPEPTKGRRAVYVDATTEGVCATCQFWGGTRRITRDGRSVLGESLGWCNNRESPAFLTMRSPDAGPMKAWRKWDAL